MPNFSKKSMLMTCRGISLILVLNILREKVKQLFIMGFSIGDL